MLEQSNVPVGSIQRILGHENRTTEIYLHSIGDSERLVMDVLSEGFSEFPRTNPIQRRRTEAFIIRDQYSAPSADEYQIDADYPIETYI